MANRAQRAAVLIPLLLGACASDPPAERPKAPETKREPPGPARVESPESPAAAAAREAAKDLRAYLEAKPAERDRLRATLAKRAVPRDPAERAALLRAALGRPARGGSSRFGEQLGTPPAEVLIATPAGYDASRTYGALIGFSAYCKDAHFSLTPFAFPREEVAAVMTAADSPTPRPAIPWEDGIVLAPVVPDLAEFDSSTYVPARSRVLNAIAHANRHYGVDPDRLVAVGYSLGSTVAYDLASRYPDRFAAIADCCGGCPRHPTPLANLASLNVYVFHGDQDPVINVIIAREIDAFLTQFQVPHVLDIAPGVKHEYPREPARGAKISDWLHKQKRDAWPADVKLALYPPLEKKHRLYWLELERTDGLGSIAVNVKDNVVAFTGASGVGKVTLHLGEPLVDLDREVVVKAGAKELFRGKLERRLETLLDDLETDGWDTVRAAPARVTVTLPR